MDFQTIYSKWYEACASIPLYSQNPDMLSIEAFKRELDDFKQQLYLDGVDISDITEIDADEFGLTASELQFAVGA